MRDTLAARRTPLIDARLRQLRGGETLFDSEGAEQMVAPRGGDRTPQPRLTIDGLVALDRAALVERDSDKRAMEGS